MVKTTEEVDEFMSTKNRNEFGLNVNKKFYDALKGFKPLKSMRTSRSRLSKIKKSKIIRKQDNINRNFEESNSRRRENELNVNIDD